MVDLNILKILSQKNNLDKNNYYLGLFLKETEGIGLVMVKKTNRLELVNWQRFKYANGWENLLEDVDNLLMQFESNLGIALTQTIFFLYSHAINNQTKEVKPIYLKTIKDLTKNLDLKPLGYIEVVDAVIAWLENKEESSINSILVEIDRSNISIFIIRGSKKINVQTTARTDNVASDINSAIQEKAGSIILPSRFILYNSHDLTKDINILMSYRWDRDLFVQLPRIDLFKEEEIMYALTNLFSSQMIINTKQNFSQKLSNNKKMGFVIGGEITQKKKSEIITGEAKMNFRSLLAKFKFPKFNWTIIAGIILSVIALISIELVLHRADLTITLPTQNIEQTMKYKIGPDDVNFKKQQIKFEISQTKPTNGKKAIGEKTKGEVTIHNFDDKEKIFNKGTIIFNDSLQFGLDEDVKVPMVTNTYNEKFERLSSPGKAKVKVTAVEIGSESNLAKGARFTIDDTPVSLFFGLNEMTFTGGSKKEVRTVAKKDLDELENSVLEKAKIESRSRIGKTLDKTFGYLDNLVNFQIRGSTYSKEVGEEASEVNLKSTIVLSFYIYKKNDLNNLAIIALRDKINSGFELDKNKTSLIVVQSEAGKEVTNIDLLVKGRAMVFVDKNKLRRQLSGKSVNEIKGIVNRNLHAISYTLQIEPSFILIKDRMPWYLNNILIKVNY